MRQNAQVAMVNDPNVSRAFGALNETVDPQRSLQHNLAEYDGKRQMANGKPHRRGVLILGTEPRISVPIARSLNRKGIPVAIAALSRKEAPVKSRAVCEFAYLPSYQDYPTEFIQALASLARARDLDMLIPATDAALDAVSQNYHELNQILCIASPPPHVVEHVLNKESTLEIARQAGIRVPRQYEINGEHDLESLSRILQFPLVAKPRRKSSAETFKARYFHSLEQLREGFASGQLDGVLLQEFCPGVGVGVEILRNAGQCVAVFQHRRIKEVPYAGGAAVVAIAEPPNPELVAIAQNLLHALAWEGVAMVEFRWNPTDHAAVLMEVNGRYWGTVSLPIQAGVDFPWYQWQLAHGDKPAVPASYAAGVRWRWSAGYLRRVRGMLPTCTKTGGSMQRKDLLASALDFMPSIHDALWSWSDPVPATTEAFRAVKQLLVSDVGVIIKKLRALTARAARQQASAKA